MEEDIRQFKLITGEHVIAKFVDQTDIGDEIYEDAIQVMLMPDYSSPDKMAQKIGFGQFPEICNPTRTNRFTVNVMTIAYRMEEVDPDYLEQYKKIFSKIVTPSSKIFTGK